MVSSIPCLRRTLDPADRERDVYDGRLIPVRLGEGRRGLRGLFSFMPEDREGPSGVAMDVGTEGSRWLSRGEADAPTRHAFIVKLRNTIPSMLKWRSACLAETGARKRWRTRPQPHQESWSHRYKQLYKPCLALLRRRLPTLA